MSQPTALIQTVPYPQGILKTLLQAPLWLHRVGLGWLLQFTPVMILTVRGRKSGTARHAVLEYRRHGSKVYAISVWGDRANWIQNAIAAPDVTIQFGSAGRAAKASMVTEPAEALRALYMFQRTSPVYESILANMSGLQSLDLRTIKEVASHYTIMRFDLNDNPPPVETVKADYGWVSPVVALVLLMLVVWAIAGTRQTEK